MNTDFDYIVIGSGYGGLSSAALLTKMGFNILVLESHTKIGGCASFYKRKDFLFDVGATTFSGAKDNQPIGVLFNKLGIKPNLKKVDPGLIVHINGKTINRYAEKEKWINEAEKYFGIKNQKEFWNGIYQLENLSWKFVNENYKLPPKTVGDFISLANPKNIKFLELILPLFQNVKSAISKYDFQNELFNKFLNEQLLITTQSSIEEAPYLTSAMGLAYPSETYYPYGGMYKPAKLLADFITQIGNEIKFKQTVTEVNFHNNYYEIKTDKGKNFTAKGIISNIPIWNMMKITNGSMRNYFQKYAEKFDFSWGAFTINFAVESKSELPSLYYQLHSEKSIPYCNSNSIFVSFSASDDREKAPDGFRTVTISTHTDVRNWDNLNKEEYLKRKTTVSNAMLEIFDNYFNNYFGSPKLFLLSGSPNTFEFYTKREKGFVGGIPHTVKKNLLFMPPNVTPFNNFYMVGDTVFPGQGTPAVILGALNISKRIESRM